MKKTLFTAGLILVVAISLQAIKNYQNSGLTTKTEVRASQGSQTNQNQESGTSQLNNVQVKSNTLKTKAVDFKLKDLNGNVVSLSQYKGKKVFLNFWATWCPPCKGEMPDIEKLYNEINDSDLVILAVDLGEKADTVKSFIDKNKYDFTVLLDTSGEVADKYRIDSIPTSYFIDKDGYIISTNVGAMSLEQMKAHVKNIDKK